MACDKEKKRANARKYYHKNKERLLANTEAYRGMVIRWYYSNIEELSCLDCGTPFKGVPMLADFHHISGEKNKSINRKSVRSYVTQTSYNNLVEELNKGVYLCPTCHRIRHLYSLNPNLLVEKLCRS